MKTRVLNRDARRWGKRRKVQSLASCATLAPDLPTEVRRVSMKLNKKKTDLKANNTPKPDSEDSVRPSTALELLRTTLETGTIN
jgi:hypothetical protein